MRVVGAERDRRVDVRGEGPEQLVPDHQVAAEVPVEPARVGAVVERVAARAEAQMALDPGQARQGAVLVDVERADRQHHRQDGVGREAQEGGDEAEDEVAREGVDRVVALPGDDGELRDGVVDRVHRPEQAGVDQAVAPVDGEALPQEQDREGRPERQVDPQRQAEAGREQAVQPQAQPQRGDGAQHGGEAGGVGDEVEEVGADRGVVAGQQAAQGRARPALAQPLERQDGEDQAGEQEVVPADRRGEEARPVGRVGALEERQRDRQQVGGGERGQDQRGEAAGAAQDGGGRGHGRASSARDVRSGW